MKYDPDIHRRRSIRLNGYDYASAGFYFVTICIQGREPLLGEIVDGAVVPNDAGRMMEHWWQKIPEKFPTVRLDQYIIMPDHFHGIIILDPGNDDVGADPRVCPGSKSSENHGGHMGPEKQENQGGHMGPPLPQIMQWFKTMSTNAYIHGVKYQNWPPFPGPFWQRNYYERIIRDETELHHIRQYIRDNPTRRTTDQENPANHEP